MLAELHHGIDFDLFVGLPDETPADRAARLDVARDVLAELTEEGQHDEITAERAAYAAALMRTVRLRPRRRPARRAIGGAA